MCQERGLISDAHIRAALVVKADVPANDAAHLVLVAEQSLTIDARCLNVRNSLSCAIKIQYVLLITRSTSTCDSLNLHC